MIYRILFFLFFLITNIYSFEITNIEPAIPFLGTLATANINGFNINEETTIFINNNKLSIQSYYITDYNDNSISFIIPEGDKESYLGFYHNKKFTKFKFETQSILNITYFSKKTHKLQYNIELDLKKIKPLPSENFAYIYIPQPLISDTLISQKVTDISIAPDYIQDNGILIYKVDLSGDRKFNFTQELEITTQYKKVDLTDDYINIDYEKETEFYRHFLRTEGNNIIPDNKIIKSKAKSIVGNEKNNLTKILKIYKWVVKNMKHKYPPDSRSPFHSLENGEGDCLSDAYLFASLARASGIPVRLNSGLIFYNKWKYAGGHFWEEAFIPGLGWIPFDVSLGHSPDFLTNQLFDTEPLFYAGGVDGYRIDFARDRVEIMKVEKKDDLDELVFWGYLESIQYPFLMYNGKINYDVTFKKRIMYIKE